MMRLDDLINAMGLHLLTPSIEIIDLISDSRQVVPYTAFIGYQGKTTDSKQHIPEAITRGACAVFTDKALTTVPSVPVIVIPDLSQQLSLLAGHFFNQPSHHLNVVGVTGTNGKTSICHYLAAAFRSLGHSVGTIGTLGISTRSDDYHYNGMTTPDPISVQRYLRQFVQEDCSWAMMEVSSHGLDQDRVKAIQWRYGIFTNLTHDHLDYHHSLEEYARAKQKLFAQLGTGVAVINADDPYAALMLDACSLNTRKILYGKDFHYISQTQADNFLQAEVMDANLQGMLVRITLATETAEIWIPLVGDFNLYNVLAVIAVLNDSGIGWAEIQSAIEKLTPACGRLQRFDQTGLPTTWVDFAHTPDGLEKILSALKPLVPGQLWVVFGCGGNRDKTKRPYMAKIAENYADKVILTQDNSRQEPPAEIIEEMLGGMQSPHTALIELDRRKAIEYALEHAKPTDWIVVAGRGHETHLQLNEGIVPFSDIVYVTEYFKNWSALNA
jgi:UDP-N-acetylmuramoyl-L-alanyl-D-glutamate--2,6-diaminopimelate ligase